MRVRSLAVLLFVLLAAWPVVAQEQSGSLEGVIKDSSGAVLPGVTVEARNVQTSGVSTAVTNQMGIYRFPALPPGQYEITATLTGFTPKKQPANLALGQLLKIDAVLSLASVTETVEVTGESPLIDVKQAATFTTVSSETIERIPKGSRDFSAVVSTAAGANQEARQGGIQVDGSSGSENRFIIDGMDTTNLQAGTQGKTMLLDFIQEVQVKSSGYNAEFGGSTGGVVSAITKSGSNNLRGSVGIYNQGDWGYGERRGYHRYAPYTIASKGTVANFTPMGGTCAAQGIMGNVPACLGPDGGLLAPDTPWSYLSPVAELGGPILKNRMWYYGGWSYAKDNWEKDVKFFSDPARQTYTLKRYQWQNYLNYNVTSQLTNNLRVKFSGANQKNKCRGANTACGDPVGLQPDNDPIGFPDGTPMKGFTTATFYSDKDSFDRSYRLNGQDFWNNTYSGNVDWVLSPTFFVNATAGYFMYDTKTPPDARGSKLRHIYAGTPAGLPGVPASLYDTEANGWFDNISTLGTLRNKFTRAFANVNATWFKSLAGQHTFKAGLRFERFGNDVYHGNTMPNITLNWGADYEGTRGTYGYYELTKSATTGNVHSNNYSLWLQDSWTINNKFTLNAGVRAENEYVPSFKTGVPNCNDAPNNPDCAIDISFGMRDKIAPRVGFAYDIKGDAKWKAYGSYSHYFDITKLELPRGSFGGDHWISYYWTLDTWDFNTINCDEGNTGCPGRFISSLDWRHSSNQIDPVFEAYFNRPGMTGIDPNLKPVQTGDFQVGLDRELNPRMSLGVRYIHKWVKRTMEDVGIYAAFEGGFVEDYLISNPGEGYAVNMEPRYPNLVTPKPKRDYDAVEVHLRKRFSNNWAADATYTYSRIYGNYPGLASSDEWGRNSPNVNRLWYNTVMSYDPRLNVVYGLLNSDRPHQFKLSGSYDFKWGTSVGAFFIMQTGLPNSTVFRASSGGYPVFPNGRGDLGRLPAYENLDLQVTHEFRLGGNRRLSLGANFDNVLDLKNTTNWYYEGYGNILWHQTGRNNLGLPITYFYTPYDVKKAAQLYTAPKSAGGYGGTLWDNAFFKVPDQYQSRRQIRVNAKLSF